MNRSSVPFVAALLGVVSLSCAGDLSWPDAGDVDARAVDADPGQADPLADAGAGDPDGSDIDGFAVADAGPGFDVEVVTTCASLAQVESPQGLPCAPGLHCEIGLECCCGACSASLVCDCQGQRFDCYWTDSCLGMPCSPECGSPGLYETAFGCRTCDEIAAGMRDGIAAALGSEVPCTLDSDCTTWKPPLECMGSCRHAVHVQQAVTLEGKLASVGEQWCQSATGCYLPEPPCEEGDPVCLGGTCAIVGPCDGVRFPLGSACDDGDRCTVDDLCMSKGVCQGQALQCDDGNACTGDRCDAAAGCVHDPLDRIACPATGACVPGATCHQGVCSDSPREGWVRTFTPPGAAFPFAAVAHPDGGWVMLTHLREILDTVPHLVRVDAAGGQVSDVRVPVQKSTEAQGLLVRADGSFVVVLRDYPDTALMALDSGGALLWRTVVDTQFAESVALSPGAGGGIGFAGTRTRVPNVRSAWFVRLDAAGKVLQDVGLGPASATGMMRIRPAGDGFAMLFGVLDSAPEGDLTDVRFARVDGSGNVVAQRTLHEDGNDFISGFVGLPDGAFAANGHRMLYQGDGKSAVGWMRRIEADGSPGWSHVSDSLFYGPAAWDGTSVVLADAVISHVSPDGQILAGDPIGAVLPGALFEILPDALGVVLAGTSGGSADASAPWLARLFDACVGGTCPRPGCP